MKFKLLHVLSILFPVASLIAILFISILFLSNYLSLIELCVGLNALLYTIILSYIYRKKYFIYFDAWFVILFPYYYVISYFFSEYIGFTPFSTNTSTAESVLYLCFSCWAFSVLIFLFRPKILKPNIYFSQFVRKISYVKSSNPHFIIIFLMALGVSLFFLKAIFLIGIENISSQSRLEALGQVGESGWYLKYFIISYSWFVGLYSLSCPRSILRKIYIYIPIVLYAISLFLLGSRRELIFIILFCFFCLYCFNNGNIKGWQITIFILISIGFIFLGILRTKDSELGILSYVNALGEFIFPISTLYFYVENNFNDFFFGGSYIQFFYDFIPRFLMSDKPLPLAVDFAYLVSDPRADYVMGYAYTPITESFVNFGWFSVLILPIMISGISLCFEYLSNRFVFLPIILLSQILNFQRTEMASLGFELVLFIFCFWVCFRFSSWKVANAMY